MLITDAIQSMRNCISEAEPASQAGQKERAIELLKSTARKILAELPDAEVTDQADDGGGE